MGEIQDDKLHKSIARLEKRLEPELEEIKKADEKRESDEHRAESKE